MVQQVLSIMLSYQCAVLAGIRMYALIGSLGCVWVSRAAGDARGYRHLLIVLGFRVSPLPSHALIVLGHDSAACYPCQLAWG